MDQAPWHSPMMNTMFDNIRIVFLPPYSPELNSTENFWKWMKQRFFYNKSFESLQEVEDTLVSALNFAKDHGDDFIKTLTGFRWAIC